MPETITAEQRQKLVRQQTRRRKKRVKAQALDAAIAQAVEKEDN